MSNEDYLQPYLSYIEMIDTAIIVEDFFLISNNIYYEAWIYYNNKGIESVILERVPLHGKLLIGNIFECKEESEIESWIIDPNAERSKQW